MYLGSIIHRWQYCEKGITRYYGTTHRNMQCSIVKIQTHRKEIRFVVIRGRSWGDRELDEVVKKYKLAVKK